MSTSSALRPLAPFRTTARAVVTMALVTSVAVAVAVGEQPTSRVDGAVAPPVVPLVPARLLETRPGNPTVDGRARGGGPVPAGTVREVVVAGRGQVPVDADAALLNVTAVFPAAPGFLTVFPCGDRRPDPASHVNYFPGGVYPNAVLAEIGTGGRVCVFTLATTDILIDVNGYVPSSGGLVPVTPARVAETRRGPSDRTFDGRFQGQGPIAAGDTFAVTVAGRGEVPPDAEAVLLNVTSVFPESPGYLTVFPCGEPRPDPASNVNYFPGGVYPNAVLAKVGVGGQICVFTLATTDVLVDVSGFVARDSGLQTVAPLRMLETRVGEPTFDDIGRGNGPVDAGDVIEIAVAGRGPVSADTSAVFVNLTAVFPEAPGFLTAYSCDEQRPDPASNVNYFPGGVYPNAVLSKVSDDGLVCVYTSARTHILVDVVGSVDAGSTGRSSVTIPDTPVEPFDRIAVEGVDAAELAELSVVMILRDGEEITVPVFADDAGPYVLAPLDPDNLGEAGSVRLRAVLGGVARTTVTIPILPLPDAPGAWTAIVDTLLERVDADLSGAGMTRAQLRALAINDVPGDLMTAYMLLRLLDDGTDADLGSALTGSLFDLAPAQRTLLEALVAQLGLADLAEVVAHQSPTATSSSSTAPAAAAPSAESAWSTSDDLRRASLQRTAVSSAAACRTKGLVITTPSQLADFMEDGVDGIILADGAERQVLDSIASFTALGSKLPGPGALIGAIGAIFATIELSEYVDSISLPTQLASLTPTGDTAGFNEDFTEPGAITSIVVVGASTGGDVSQWVNQIISTFFSTVVGSEIGSGLSGSDWSALEQHVAGQVLGTIADTALGQQLAALGPLVEPFCAEQWPVELVGQAQPVSTYVTARPVLGKLAADLASLTYRPTELGRDQLRFVVRSERFSDRSATGYLAAETKPIIIDVSPDLVVLDNSLESFTLTATVTNADNTEIEWSTPLDTFTSSPGPTSFNYDAPAYPHPIVARSTSTTGLRGLPGATERNDLVEVRLNEIRIGPADVTLAPGETLQMTVTDMKGQAIDPSKVTWDSTGGMISPSGLYTAGSEAGNYEITARLDADPTKVDSTAVMIAVDSCIYGTWAFQVQRYLDDQQAAFPDGPDSQTHDSGSEVISFTPRQPELGFYPTYSIAQNLTITSVTDDITYTFDRRGTESGEFEIVDDGGPAVSHFPDTSDYEMRLTRTDEFGTDVGPWQAGGGPLSQAGSLFGYNFTCDGNELAMAPDGFYTGLTTYWTRIG